VITPIEFAVEGTTVRGRIFSPNTDEPAPGLVMAPGFTATSHFAVFESYARGLAASGVAVLLFDVRSLGYSDGDPRHVLDPWAQARDYLGALEALRSADGIDPDRVGVWGVSLSAGISSVVAAVDPKVAAAVLLVPAYGDDPPLPDADGARFESIRSTILEADLGSLERTVTDPLPVVSVTQASVPSLLTGLTAYRWFTDAGTQYGTRWANEASIARTDTPTPFEAATCAGRIAAPTLMLIAEHDEMEGADADVARAVFDAAPQQKQLVTVQRGHFGVLYDGSPEFDASLAAQQQFLREHLLG
jgi:pimeloyl-ACP methyl ester carboxylesterase